MFDVERFVASFSGGRPPGGLDERREMPEQRWRTLGGSTARTPAPRGGQGQRRRAGARVGEGTGPSPGLQKFENRPCASSGNPHAALKDLTETAGTLCI